MPRGYPPSVFVSSTCYDLGQVRLNLKAFVESLGYEATISESTAFPVDPHEITSVNCIKAVRERADLFVLIVGTRYGTQVAGGKSITNLEYLEAKTKGVPIYVFVAKNILHTLPLWKTNPKADFSGTVDSPKLYEFVDQLRGAAGHWVYSFESAEDIVSTLRSQWALLFTDALAVRAQLRASPLSNELVSAPPQVLAIALERPSLWEFKLLSAALKCGLEALTPLRNDLRYQLAIGPVERVGDPAALMDLIQDKLSEIKKITEVQSHLLNTAANEALGPPGTPGNPDLIVYVAKRLVEAVRQALEWSIGLNAVDADAEFSTAIKILGRFSSELIEQVSGLPTKLDALVQEAAAALARGESKFHGELNLKYENTGVGDELVHEMQRLREIYGLDNG